MVFLAFDHSDITTHSAATIRRAAVDARALRPDGINITGYTDRAGQDGYNQTLSRRAAPPPSRKDWYAKDSMDHLNQRDSAYKEGKYLFQTTPGGQINSL